MMLGIVSLILPPAGAADDGTVSLARPLMVEELLAVPEGGTVVLADLPWREGNLPASAVVSRREVFAPGSAVHVATDQGTRTLPPPRLAVFIGRSAGDPDTSVVLTVGEKGPARLLAISPDGVREYRRASPGARWESAPQAPKKGAAALGCRAEELEGAGPPAVEDGARASRAAGSPRLTTYRATVAIDSDYEFYQLFNDTTAAASYLATVIAAASAIYERDLSVQLQMGDIYLWNISSDPWTATDPVGVLMEFGDYWHANRQGVVRDLAHFFSGKSLGGGVAWRGVVCSADFYSTQYSAWGGAYGICGDIDGTFDPNSSSPWVRWDLICSSHEMGHNFVSPHTHCYNDWPNPGDPPVDECYSGETGCYSGPTSLPTDGGTIMSYCHGLSGGLSNINLYFGLAGHYGVQSERVPQRMRSYVESIANPPACLEEVAVGPIPGDADGDLDVDGADLSMIAQEIFDMDGTATADMCNVTPPCPEAEADADANGRIQAADLAVAIQNA